MSKKIKNNVGKMIDARTAVGREIAALDGLNFAELKGKFKELYGFDCSQTNVRNLRRRLTYRIQEIYFGGLSSSDATYLDEIAKIDPLSNLEAIPPKKLTKTPGTRFTRVWKGIMHEVIVTDEGGLEYGGKRYRSLTAIANKITGSHWNGKVFFGVR
jgi:hypothetical protein